MENQKTNTQKLWQITLYTSTSEIDWLSKKEKYLVKQYEQVQGYIKAYKKEIYSGVNPDSQSWLIDTKDRKKWVFSGNELKKIKLDNIEVYSTNVELERLGKLEQWILPLRKSQQQKQRVKENSKTIWKISTQQQLNNNVDMCMSWQKNISPLDYVENKYRAEILTQKTKENIHLILWYKKLKEKLAKAYKNKKNHRTIIEKMERTKFDIKQEVFIIDNIE
jgi:hypothetical protein